MLGDKCIKNFFTNNLALGKSVASNISITLRGRYQEIAGRKNNEKLLSVVQEGSFKKLFDHKKEYLVSWMNEVKINKKASIAYEIWDIKYLFKELNTYFDVSLKVIGYWRLRINEEQLKEALMRILTDECCRRILSSSEKPISVADLSNRLDIPLSSTYRRVKTLVSMGLLVVVKSVVTEDGKKYNLYQSAVEDISVRFTKGHLQIDITPRAGLTYQFTKLLRSLKEGL
jgi:predicted transcriptional regulator